MIMREVKNTWREGETVSDDEGPFPTVSDGRVKFLTYDKSDADALCDFLNHLKFEITPENARPQSQKSA